MSAEVAAILRSGKALIDTPEKWTRGDYEEIDEHGTPTGCYCAMGALMKAQGIGWDTRSLVDPVGTAALVAALPGAWDRSCVENWNDEVATHANVMDLFDRAIAAEESQA